MDDDENNSIFQIIAIGVLIGAFFIGLVVADVKAEERNLEKDCYLNMTKKQSLVCMESMRLMLEKMTKETEQLLASIEPINTEG